MDGQAGQRRPRNQYPVYVTEDPASQDHHALFLDLVTIDVGETPQLAKYKIYRMKDSEWDIRNRTIAMGPKFQQLQKKSGA